MYTKSQIRSMFLLLFFLFFSVILVYSFAGGDGSLGNPYQITNCSDLQNMSFDLSANYTLNNNIDCGVSPFNTGAGFKPIGDLSTNAFRGNLNGNNYEIQNLYINNVSLSYTGLFGYLLNTSISNIVLTNVNVTGSSQVGGLVGRIINSNVSNSYVTGQVKGTGVNVGGVIGKNGFVGDLNNYFSNLGFNGIVNGTSISIGGLIGRSYGGNLDNSYFIGNVYGNNDWVGGLLGRAQSGLKINNSYSEGEVSGLDHVGGLVGSFLANGFINSSYSSMDVNGVNYLGGLVGYNEVSIENSYATGNVNGSNYVGGLIGFNGYYGVIENSYSTGNVNGSNNIGGLIGMNSENITNSYSTGNVNGNSNVGGFIGYQWAGIIDNSYWNNESSQPRNMSIGFNNNAQSATVIQDNISYFYNSNNPPMVNWTSGIWTFSELGFPVLTWAFVPSSSSSGLVGIFPVINPLILVLVLFGIISFLLFA